MNLAEDIYPQVDVKKKVAKVYHQVIIFGREATNYFLAPSLGAEQNARKVRRLLIIHRENTQSDRKTSTTGSG